MNAALARCLVTTALALAGLCPAAAQSIQVLSITSSLGDDIMTDGARRTVYTYDLDYHDWPTCTDACAETWPPFEPEPGAFPGGAFTIVVRTDGRRQWSYLGSPLYYYSKDRQPYDVRGQGIGGVWRYARLPGGND